MSKNLSFSTSIIVKDYTIIYSFLSLSGFVGENITLLVVNTTIVLVARGHSRCQRTTQWRRLQDWPPSGTQSTACEEG